MTTKPEKKSMPTAKPSVPADPALARIQDLLTRYQDHLTALLGKHLTIEQLYAVARLALGRVPKLKECTAASVLGCVMEAARLGLQAGGGPGETWLVPRQNRETGQVECTLVVDYRAILKLLRRDAGLAVAVAEPVREGDLFERGVGPEGPFVRWQPAATPGRVYAYFAAAWDRDHNLLGVVYRTVEELDRSARARSAARDRGPWVTDPDWMYRKSVVRPLAKLIPSAGQDAARAAALDERADLGLPQDLHLLADPTAAPTPEPVAEASPAPALAGPVKVDDVLQGA